MTIFDPYSRKAQQPSIPSTARLNPTSTSTTTSPSERGSSGSGPTPGSAVGATGQQPPGVVNTTAQGPYPGATSGDYGPDAPRYRSGALSAVSMFLGFATWLLPVVLIFVVFTHTVRVCDAHTYDLSACLPDVSRTTVSVCGLAMVLGGSILTAVGGSLVKRKRAGAGAIVLAITAAGLYLLAQMILAEFGYQI